MKKTTKRYLSMFLSILLVLSTVGSSAFAGTSKAGSKGEESLKIKDFSVTGEKEYFSGEEVLLNLNLELTDDVGTIEDSYMEVKIPKDYIEKDTIAASDISSLDFEFNVSEEGNNYIVKYELKTISSSTKLSIPLRFRTQDYLTPNGYKLPIESTYNFDGESVESNLEIEIKTGEFEGELFLNEKEIGTLGHSKNDDQKLYAGYLDKETGNLSEDSDKLNTINVGYVFKNVMEKESKNIGNRRFEKLIVEMELPEGAEFVEQEHWGNSYKWKFDEKTRIATLEDKGLFGDNIDEGKVIKAGTHNTLSFHDLGIKFPGAENESEHTILMKITGIPYNKGDNEEDIIVEDSISFKIYGKEEDEKILTGFYSYKGKGSIGGGIIDHEAFRENENIDWDIAFSKKFNQKDLEEIVILDKELDERLYYKGITINENYFGDYKVRIEAIDESRDSKIIKDKISSKNGDVEVNFNQKDIKEVKITILDAKKVSTSDMIKFTLHTGVKNPEMPLIVNDENEALTNTAEFKVKYKDEDEQSKTHNAISTITRLDPKVYLDREIVEKEGGKVENFFVNEVVNTKLTMGAEHFVRGSDEIKLDSIIEILPEGINYVEGSSKVTIDKADKTEEIIPEIVHNYKDSGKTALIWNFGEISLKGVKEEKKFEEIIEDLITISYDAKITQYAYKGVNEFEAYLKLTEEDYFKPKNESEDSLNINGDSKKKIEKNVGQISFKPAKELLVRKEVKGSLNDYYKVTPNIGHTELGEELSFKITIINNRDDAIESLYLMDIFPFDGDEDLFKSIEGSKRASTLGLSLKEVIGIPDEFEVYYITEEAKTDLVNYYKSVNWTKEIEDLEAVKAIKLELKEGVKLEPEYRKSFELKFKAPENGGKGLDDKLVNSVLTATSSDTSSDLSFTESNSAIAEISQHLITGSVFEDINKNGNLDEEDKPLEGMNVYLYDKDNKPVLDSQGEHIKVQTDSKGEYSIGIRESGNYKIKVEGRNGYDFISKENLDEGNFLSNEITLNSASKKAVINVGLTRRLINIKVEKIWIDSPEEKPNIEIQLYRDGKEYEDPITLKSGESEYTWEDLYLADEEGNEYEYTVDEVEVPKDYSKEVDGFKITNTYLKIYTLKVVDEDGKELEENKGLTKEELDKEVLSKKEEYEGKDYEIIEKEVSEDGKTTIIKVSKNKYILEIVEVDGNDKEGKILEKLENITKEDLDKRLAQKETEYKDKNYTILEIKDLENGKKIIVKAEKSDQTGPGPVVPERPKPEDQEPEDSGAGDTRPGGKDSEDKLDKLNHFEYIQGYPDKTVRPENNITREEVAAVFYRLLNEEYKQSIYSLTNNFTDLSDRRWSNKHISTLANGGILKGYEDGEFKYSNFITRAEVAAIASRFENLEVSNHNFTDVKGHWAEKYIGSASKKGWIEGYEDGSFRPNEYITRAEFVTLVNRVLNRGVEKDNILEGIEKFKDLKENKWYYEEFVEAINGHIFYRENDLDRKSEEWLELKEFNMDM